MGEAPIPRELAILMSSSWSFFPSPSKHDLILAVAIPFDPVEAAVDVACFLGGADEAAAKAKGGIPIANDPE